MDGGASATSGSGGDKIGTSTNKCNGVNASRGQRGLECEFSKVYFKLEAILRK